MDTCKKIECHRSRYNNFTVFCEKHKCSHCDKEAVGEINIACVEHEKYEGGPYVYPDHNGKFRNKFK